MDRKAWTVIIFCVIGIMLNAYYAAKNQPPPAVATAAPAPTPAAEKSPVAQPAASTVADSKPVQEQRHSITIGTVTWELSSAGGGIARAVLKGKDEIVLNTHGKEPVGALRHDPSGRDGIKYTMLDASSKGVMFSGTTKDGIVVKKTYSIKEGEQSDEHLLALKLELHNPGATTFAFDKFYLYAGAAKSLRPDDIQKPSFFWNNAGDAYNHDSNWFGSGWFSKNPLTFQQDFTNLRWGGVMSRFYAHIISTKDGVENQPGRLWSERFLVDHTGDEFNGTSGADTDYAVEGAVGLPPVELKPGETKVYEYEVYLGPKQYHRLAAIERQRSFVMFYGMWGFISRLFINLLNWLHTVTGSWGWAIVLLTIVVRLFLWPFHAKSQRSMKRMGKLAPIMKEMQEKYKDDPQRQSQEVMKLYRDYGVNPIGGCVPMLFQIPIFFGFFSMLGSAAELRGESFFWVKDLSLPDTVTHLFGFPINPLPLLMGITMFLQMKLTPQPATVDKTQQRIFMFMPFMFLIFCYAYAAALALYWTTQNIFSIGQSWIMKKFGTDDDGPLQKVERVKPGPAPVNPFAMPGQKPKKEKKTHGPRLGGGGTSSRSK
ncbi:MAG: membrane protein insertase YidC [Verrucomicrobiaceae bacterium]|nr:membrane protein insertase YidC [Verrucomicrobiaceae bacterium]